MKPMKQTVILIVLGSLDLVTTIVLIRRHGAAEANPLMAGFLSKGISVFILAKLGLLLTPIALLEWSRRFSPAFVIRACNTAIAAYLCLYAVGVVRANIGPDERLAYAWQARTVWEKTRQRIEYKRATGLLPASQFDSKDRASGEPEYVGMRTGLADDKYLPIANISNGARPQRSLDTAPLGPL